MLKNPIVKGFLVIVGASCAITACSSIYYQLTTSPQQKKFDDCIQRVAGRQIGSGVKEAQIICLREQ